MGRKTATELISSTTDRERGDCQRLSSRHRIMNSKKKISLTTTVVERYLRSANLILSVIMFYWGGVRGRMGKGILAPC
jgi:hypothetical protein